MKNKESIYCKCNPAKETSYDAGGNEYCVECYKKHGLKINP